MPLSVWPTGQQPSRKQREDRYLPESNAHPAKMLPAIAAQAIEAYTEPGDLVLDPMCGIGTTLVEAVHLDRCALGVEYESHWARLARANLAHAYRHGATGTGRVVHGDARHTASLAGSHLGRRVSLVLTSPPYGASTHGHVTSSRDSGQTGIAKRNQRYSRDRANLAHRDLHTLLGGFTDILVSCAEPVRPGGVVAITTRPFRQNGELIDFPSAVFEAAQAAGLERVVALLAALRGGDLVSRVSFFALHEVRKARARGEPRHVVAHEDLLVLRKPHEAQGRVTELRPAAPGHTCLPERRTAA